MAPVDSYYSHGSASSLNIYYIPESSVISLVPPHVVMNSMDARGIGGMSCCFSFPWRAIRVLPSLPVDEILVFFAALAWARNMFLPCTSALHRCP